MASSDFKPPFIVGLTGAIGSGKTTVSRYFQALGTPTFNADHIAQNLSLKGEIGHAAILKQFGPTWLNHEGELNRDKIRDIIFNDPQQRQKLESILHPLVYLQLRTLSQKIHASYVVWDVPLLIGTNGENAADHILVVHADLSQRLQWIQERSHWDQDTIQKTIDSQLDPEELLLKADEVIHNTGSLDALAKRVKECHQIYRAKARSAKSSKG